MEAITLKEYERIVSDKQEQGSALGAWQEISKNKTPLGECVLYLYLAQDKAALHSVEVEGTEVYSGEDAKQAVEQFNCLSNPNTRDRFLTGIGVEVISHDTNGIKHGKPCYLFTLKNFLGEKISFPYFSSEIAPEFMDAASVLYPVVQDVYTWIASQNIQAYAAELAKGDFGLLEKDEQDEIRREYHQVGVMKGQLELLLYQDESFLEYLIYKCK